MQQQVYRNVCKFITNKALKYHIYIKTQTLYSVLCWSTFGSGYSLLRYDDTSLAHLYLGVSPILLCKSSQALSGRMGSVAAQLFSGLPRDVWVQVWVLAGPLKDIQRLVPKTLLHCLGCVFRVVVLLEGEPSSQSEVLSTLEQVFILDLSVLCSVHLSLDTD